MREHAAKSDASPLVDSPELELVLGCAHALAHDLEHALTADALLFGSLRGAPLCITREGKVRHQGSIIADSPGALLERAVRRCVIVGSTFLVRAPAVHAYRLAQAAGWSHTPEASDAFGDVWASASGQAIAEHGEVIFGVSKAEATEAIVEAAATHAIPLKLEAPGALRMVRPPSKAPRGGARAKGVEALAWCHPRVHGVVRFERRRRRHTISQWLFTGERVLEILRPGLEVITWEQFTGLTDEFDGLLSDDCIAWLRGEGATLDPRHGDDNIPGMALAVQTPLRQLSGLTSPTLEVGVARHDVPPRFGHWPVVRSGQELYWVGETGAVFTDDGDPAADSVVALIEKLYAAELQRLLNR